MKKVTAFVIGLSFLFPLATNAASFVVSPTSGSYTAGNTVTLQVSVNPAGATIYTAMLDARFSPETFEVISFTLNEALLPLKQSGYDALSNSAGVLTKTGGFTGITSPASFGTVVLRAKTSGSGTFTVADSSKLLDGTNTDQQSGSQTNTYTIAAVPTSIPVADTPVEKPQTITKISAQVKSVPTEKIEINTPSAKEATSSQAAAIATSDSSVNLMWVLVLIVAVAAFAGGYVAGIRRFGL